MCLRFVFSVVSPLGVGGPCSVSPKHDLGLLGLFDVNFLRFLKYASACAILLICF